MKEQRPFSAVTNPDPHVKSCGRVEKNISFIYPYKALKSHNNNNNNNKAVHTDREVTANRPDITIKNKKEKTCTLTDVAIPADRNVVQKEVEKKLKYKSLGIEIERMYLQSQYPKYIHKRPKHILL